METFYTYLRDEKKRPIVTRCILIDDGNTYFGQAMCSDKDAPVKKVGRAKAYGRAIQAKHSDNFVSMSSKNNKTFVKSAKELYLFKVVLSGVELKWLKLKGVL